MSNTAFLLASSLLALSAGACVSDTTVVDPDELVTATVTRYQITDIELPTSPGHARSMGLDVSGDQAPDNQLGMVYGSFLQISPDFQIEPVVEPRLASDLTWSLLVYREPDGTVIGARLARSDETTIAPALLDRADPSAPLEGGAAAFPLGAMSDRFGDGDAGWITARDLRIAIDEDTDQAITARIGFAIPEAELRAVLAPNLARYFTWELGLGISQFAVEVDADANGEITVDELYAHQYVQALLTPDLDNVNAISLGLRVTATR